MDFELTEEQQMFMDAVDGFAERYVFNWEMVEADARARTEDFIAWYAANVAQ